MTTTMSTMTSRCEEDSQSDYVSVTSDHVTQGDRATSDNHATAQDHVTSAARRMCGANAQYTDVEQVRSEASTLYVTGTPYFDSTLDDVEVLASCLSTSDVQGTARVQYPRLTEYWRRNMHDDSILYAVSTLYVNSTPYFDSTLDDVKATSVVLSANDVYKVLATYTVPAT